MFDDIKEELRNLSIGNVRQIAEPYFKDMERYYKDECLYNLLDAMAQDSRAGVKTLYNKLFKEKISFEKEIQRVNELYNFDKQYNVKYVAGIDEVGRGPLAGPIVAAAVVLDLKKLIYYINDSKKIPEDKREKLSVIIKESAISYNIVEMSNKEIDDLGIGYCNNEVFIRAVEGLDVIPDIVLTDGYAIKNWNKLKNDFVIKGDTKSASIACASIIAKVYRDNLMKQYDAQYPQYGFNRNVGYGTGEHIAAIKKYGSVDIHRKSFLTKLNG